MIKFKLKSNKNNLLNKTKKSIKISHSSLKNMEFKKPKNLGSLKALRVRPMIFLKNCHKNT